MGIDEQSFWDVLSGEEGKFVTGIMRELGDEPWAQPLLCDIERGGGLKRENKTRFFELRFGYALREAGVIAQYEVAGEAESTLDFGFTTQGQGWLVELMRLEETQAVRKATSFSAPEDGIVQSARILETNADDPRHSEEGETVKAVERICQKCERNGRPHKFPALDGSYRVILVDFRTFLHGGDVSDRVHVGLGGEHVSDEFCRRYLKGKLISGVFSPHTALRGAAEARERVHFLGFVDEKAYRPGVIGRATQFIANPCLFSSTEEVRAAMTTWPLQPTQVINGAG